MQATEFSTALSRIITETKLQQVAALLIRVLTGENISASNLHDSFPKAVFSARSELDALKKDPTLLNVIQTLAIDDPLEPVRLGRILRALHSFSSTHELRANQAAFQDFYTVWVGIRDLMQFSRGFKTLVIDHRLGEIEPDESTLEFEIVDPGNNGIALQRLEEILKSLHELHDLVARLLDCDAALIVVALDSGSNSLITFKSDGKVVDYLRKFFLDVWDKLRYRNLEDASKLLKTATEGIQFLDLIAQKEREKVLNPQEAAQFRHLAVKETLGLFGKGVTLKELQQAEVVSHTTLLVEKMEVKYLEGSPPKQPQLPDSQRSSPTQPQLPDSNPD